MTEAEIAVRVALASVVAFALYSARSPRGPR